MFINAALIAVQHSNSIEIHGNNVHFLFRTAAHSLYGMLDAN